MCISLQNYIKNVCVIHLFYMIYTTCYKGKKETCAKEELCSLIKQNDLILSQLEGLFRQLKK